MEKFFNPKSVAVVGASREPNKVGNVIVKNLLSAHFKGRIYPINPNAEEILELKCYKSVLDIPGNVDTAIISVPAKFTPSVMEE